MVITKPAVLQCPRRSSRRQRSSLEGDKNIVSIHVTYLPVDTLFNKVIHATRAIMVGTYLEQVSDVKLQ